MTTLKFEDPSYFLNQYCSGWPNELTWQVWFDLEKVFLNFFYILVRNHKILQIVKHQSRSKSFTTANSLVTIPSTPNITEQFLKILNLVCFWYLTTLKFKDSFYFPNQFCSPRPNELTLQVWLDLEKVLQTCFFALVLEEVLSPSSLWPAVQMEQGEKGRCSISTHFSEFGGFPIGFLVSICSSPPGEGLESSSYIY